jgi:hypothetical protein
MAKENKKISAKEVSNYLYSNYGITLAKAKKLGNVSVKQQKLSYVKGKGGKAPGIITSDMRALSKSAKAERGRTVARTDKKKK